MLIYCSGVSPCSVPLQTRGPGRETIDPKMFSLGLCLEDELLPLVPLPLQTRGPGRVAIDPNMFSLRLCFEDELLPLVDSQDAGAPKMVVCRWKSRGPDK